MTTPQHPHDLVGKARIRVFSGALGHADHVMAEGDVIAYCDVPTLLLRHDDGSRSSWNVTLRREVVGPFGGTPDVLPPSESEREQAAYERGVAEGRRLATEQIVEAIKAAARLAWTKSHWTGLNAAAEIASRLVGPWEPAEQATPSCTCPMVDVTNPRARLDGVAEFVQGFDPGCLACRKPRAEQDGADRG